jgi:hypothetical protein
VPSSHVFCPTQNGIVKLDGSSDTKLSDKYYYFPIILIIFNNIYHRTKDRNALVWTEEVEAKFC